MKKVSLLIVAVALLLTGNVFAADVDPCSENLRFLEPTPVKISAQIKQLLKERSGFNLGTENEMEAVVRFTVNNESEIVVLSVNTADERLENFVKARLNYEKVADQSLEEGKIYAVPIRMRA